MNHISIMEDEIEVDEKTKIIKELLEWLEDEHMGLRETFLEQFPEVREWVKE